jgi:hypothetical protein
MLASQSHNHQPHSIELLYPPASITDPQQRRDSQELDLIHDAILPPESPKDPPAPSVILRLVRLQFAGVKTATLRFIDSVDRVTSSHLHDLIHFRSVLGWGVFGTLRTVDRTTSAKSTASSFPTQANAVELGGILGDNFRATSGQNTPK